MKKSLNLSWIDKLVIFNIAAAGMMSCSLEDVCNSEDVVCALCDDEETSECTGMVYGDLHQNSTYDRCQKYTCDNGVFTKEKICEDGFDHKTKDCFPKCILDDVRCIAEDESSASCRIYQCRIDTETRAEKWAETDVVCKEEFDSSSKLCAESCKLGTHRFDDETHPTRAEVCAEGDTQWMNKWVEEMKCPFGIKDKNERPLKCVNPCEINGKTNNKSILYDEKEFKYYACDENGWYETSCGGNDFHKTAEDFKDNDIEQFKANFNIESGRRNDLGINHIQNGICGECGRETSPDYCVKKVDNNNNTKYVNHRCKNGELSVETKDDCMIKDNSDNTCIDNDGQEMIVDKSNNFYHCGSCGHVCGRHEKCEKSVCKSSYECDEGEYIRIDIGTRWVNAYCMTKPETFAAMRDAINGGKVYPNEPGASYNHDNAYVLGKDIDLTSIGSSTGWEPVGKDETVPFSGVLFGNRHSITIGKIKPGTYMGLFGYVKNAVIQSLELVSGKSHEGESHEGESHEEEPHEEEPHEVSIISDSDNLVRFGLLAGSVYDSKVSDVEVDYKNKGVDIVLNDSAVKENRCKKTSPLDEDTFSESRHYVGGVIGYLRRSDHDVILDGCSVNNLTYNIKYGYKIDEGVSECSSGYASRVDLGGVVGRTYNEKNNGMVLRRIKIDNVKLNDEISNEDNSNEDNKSIWVRLKMSNLVDTFLTRPWFMPPPQWRYSILSF